MFGLNRVLATSLTVASAIALTSGVANAGSLHNGWNYAIDSFNDGTSVSAVGATSDYEFYGMAFTEINNSIYMAINSNLSLAGASYSDASDGHIGYGDLFFNFSGNNAEQTNADGGFYGIRFATNSDSLAPELGVYSNVTGGNVTATNSGYTNLVNHSNRVNNLGGSADLADMNQGSEADAYFGNGYDGSRKLPNSIASGTKIGGISLLDSTALSAAGLDFGNFGASGNYTFGFSFDRSLLPTGDFIAHLFAECINDGLVMKGQTTPVEIEPTDAPSVPEPGSVIALATLAIVGGTSQLRRQSLGSN